MAFFEPLTCGTAVLVSGSAAAIALWYCVGWLRRMLFVFTALCVLDLALLAPHALLWSQEPLRWAGAALATALHSATFSLHAPSIFVLGIDENLERYGVLVAAAGRVADLALYAFAYVRFTR